MAHLVMRLSLPLLLLLELLPLSTAPLTPSLPHSTTASTTLSTTPSLTHSRRPVFLKFYKVGSESVLDFFLRMSVDPRGRGYKQWPAKTPACEGLPMVSE